MLPIETKLLPLDDINTLKPGFDGEYGWLSMQELNCIDPDCIRFEIIDDATFIDNSVFVLVNVC